MSNPVKKEIKYLAEYIFLKTMLASAECLFLLSLSSPKPLINPL